MSVRVIAVGVDGSEVGQHALRWAAELAAQLGARVIAVHAFEPLSYLGRVEPPVDFALLRERCARELAEQWCRPLTEAGVEFATELIDDEPVGALVDAADAAGADLIVVGARGGSTLRGLVLGSTSLKLPHETRRPVCIVHPEDGDG